VAEEGWQLDLAVQPDPAAAERVPLMRRDWKRAVERSLKWARAEEERE
jgi:hypothetical protein